MKGVQEKLDEFSVVGVKPGFMTSDQEGKDSAFDVFGPQKGMSKENIEKHKLEVERLITLIDKELVLGLNPNEMYSGAAGGLTFTLNQILGCEIKSGAKYFVEETNLIELLKN